jgi:hypothetical protein
MNKFLYLLATTALIAVSGSAAQAARHDGIRGDNSKPSKWCGWYMRQQRGGGPEFNVAANWRRYGKPGKPQVGAVVVWDHHVGEITGRTAQGQWIVRSGNDGGRIRERVRSITGASIRV